MPESTPHVIPAGSEAGPTAMRARGAIVGFMVYRGSSPGALVAARKAQARVLGRFGHLRAHAIVMGRTTLDVWGPGALETRLHHCPDGSLLALVGAPHGTVSWTDLPRAFLDGDAEADAELPWEGRVVLLRISADGERWTIWNDWMGAITVFHADGPPGTVAGTLEPAVVAAMGYTRGDIRHAALLCILLNGHLLADWTLFNGMRTLPPDSVSRWDGAFRSRSLGSVSPSRDRWETRWDDLVDEMHALATAAVRATLHSEPAWMLPLSGGLDSRLLACIGTDLQADLAAYAWGSSDTMDVIGSRAVARTLGMPWTHVDLGRAYLATYTRPWAEWFGSSMHFHGMYQMAFYDAVAHVSGRPVASGFLNDILSGTSGSRQVIASLGQLYSEWYRHWTIDELRDVLRVPVDEALAELATTIDEEVAASGDVYFKHDLGIGLRNRNRLFTAFQLVLADYWRGSASPFMNRAYARFCLSLPRGARDNRALLRDVFRRFYPKVAAIPGTYDDEPMLRTGRYLLKRRMAAAVPASLHKGPLKVFAAADPRMDCDALRAAGPAGLWPIPEAERELSDWLDTRWLQPLYDRATSDARDYRALRRLQSVQALAYRLLDS